MEIEDYDYNKLNSIREQIENMSKFNQIEILRILTNHSDVIINENKYGIHINLSEISPNIINKLEMHIKYVQNQELDLNNAEKQKEKYKNTFFIKDNKEIAI
uniref:NET domain-containing protein n=1 Tax=viral metagenome TaxID=1070528 RepID=A0A6C0KN94_9ZZZZ